MFYFDNSKVHWNDEIPGTVKKLGLRWITIHPYSPQLNDWEKIIAVIKTKLKINWLQNKSLSLTLLKRIIDEIDQKVWELTWSI